MSGAGERVKPRIDWTQQPLGEVSDRELSERLGVSLASVFRARTRRRIAACRRHYVVGSLRTVRVDADGMVSFSAAAIGCRPGDIIAMSIQRGRFVLAAGAP